MEEKQTIFNNIDMKNYTTTELTDHEDRTVGIFGNTYSIIFEDDKGIQQQINCTEDQLYKIRNDINKLMEEQKCH